MFRENESEEKKPIVSSFLTLGRLRDILLIALIVVVGIRLSVNGFDFNLEGFNFTDFLSLFLAVSSVGLSAAFYFKADESARTFYTHTYRFTKDVSEMLGRIDSGFGEKLRNIDQGYIGLSQKFDSFGLFPKQGESDKDKLEEGNAQIKAERESIMRDLSERADIAESDKRNMLVKMNELTAELEKANSESVMINDVGGYGVTYSFVRFLTPLVFKYCGGIARDSNYERAITKAFTGVLSESEFKSAAYGYMQNAGLLNGPFLTTKGVAFVSDILSGVI